MEEPCDGDSSTESSSTECAKRRKPPDGGFGWIIVFSAFVINLITDGCSYSFGVLFTYLIEYFQESRSATAWIGSVFCAVPLLCGPIASIVTKRLGFRKSTILGGVITAVGFIASAFVNSVDAMAFTYGFIAGLGISLPYLNSAVVVALYFEKKRTLATGIAECGAGIGTLIFAPLYEYLIEIYGWRGAVLIIGAISLNIVICGAVFRPLVSKPVCEAEHICNKNNETKNDEVLSSDKLLSPEINNLPSGVVFKSNSMLGETIANSGPIVKATISCKELYDVGLKTKCDSFISKHKTFVDFSVLLNSAFLLFMLSNIILLFWYDVPYVFTVDRAKLFGITEKMAAIIVSVIGVTHTIGNLMFGYLGDCKRINRIYLYSLSLMLTGLVLGLVPLFKAFSFNTLLAGLFGLFSASPEALTIVIIVDILGTEKLTDAYGIVMFLQGVANLIGPPFAGWLYDISGSYDNTFYSAGSCVAVAGIIVLVTSLCKSSRQK